MRIAQVAPLFERVPPVLYGGTERVVSYLTEELVRQGHEVFLFASGDSETSAELIPVCERSLRLDPRCMDPVAFNFLLMEKVIGLDREFDIIHSHIDYFGFDISRRTRVPVVSTLHGRLDLWEHSFIFREYSEVPLVSISNAQRAPLPWANWAATVHHGLPRSLYTLNSKGGDYLLFVGRISPEKRVDSAIDIATAAGVPLKIAAKVDRADREYFEKEIKHLLDNPLVEFIGEVDEAGKNALMGGALAFIHPVDWPEPFGLSMLEAMACGTPVVARRRGSIPEVVDHGVTGFVFEENAEAVKYIKERCPGFSRQLCRERFEERFLSGRMAREYAAVYDTVLSRDGGAKQSA